MAIFTTNVDAENQCLINHKCVCGALNRHFCQAAVCALHEQSAPAASNSKISKLQIILVKQCSKQVYFSRGCKSLMHGVVPEALASRKLVVGDDSSEGSETAKSGTDEQKRYMRHNCLG